MKRFFNVRNTLILICLILLAADMIFIFHNSAETAQESNEKSTKIAETVANIVVKDFDKMEEPEKTEVLRKTDGIVRESAHMLEFVPLGFFLAAALLLWRTPEKKTGTLVISGITVLSGILYALTDELHQLAVDGRGFQLFDIMMDGTGALLGCAAAVIVFLIITKKTASRKNEKNEKAKWSKKP